MIRKLTSGVYAAIILAATAQNANGKDTLIDETSIATCVANNIDPNDVH